MIPTHLKNSRYLPKARAAHVARLVAAGAIVVLPTACGSSDESAFTTVAAATTPVTAAVTEAATAPATAVSTAATDPATTTDSTATQSPDGAGTALAAGSQLELAFTYAASDGGQVKNPYIAAWVEDANGTLIQTIAVWFESGKGERWLPDLSSWYAAVGSGDVTTSGATKTAGSYTLAWDGLDSAGTAAPAGTYTVFVESARERGPHSITSAEVTLDGAATTATLADSGELSALSITVA